MSNISKEEYWELCQALVDQYYNQEEDLDSYAPEESWIPAESPAKEKLNKMMNHNGFIDFTKASQSQIINKLHNANNFMVGNFLIKVIKFKGQPNCNLTLDIIIYEEKTIRNKFFKDTKISVKVDALKDMRFHSRPWAGYFTTEKRGVGIPIESMPEIIRWIQAVQKMKAFL